MPAQSSGWRSVKPVRPQVSQPYTTDKTDLYEAARLAMRVLDIPTSGRFILEQLIGAYGGKLVSGRMLVWPSNDFLEKRTNLAERTIRHAISNLLQLGVIAAVDSANGKRFARRDASGEVVEAYGFDLSPLLNRLSEFTDRMVAIRERERERQAQHDQITIDRRTTQETLRALAEQFPEEDTRDLMKRALELVRVTPRRSFKGSTDDIRAAWSALRQEVETKYHTACGGNNCRHKDNNKHAPENPCNNGNENVEEETPKTNRRDLIAACPEAMEFAGDVRSDGELVAAAGRLRGMLGVSPSAWEEARREIGPLPAAATLIMVLQIQLRPSPGVEIKNFGGYFRAMCRLIKEGRVSLDSEIKRMRR